MKRIETIIPIKYDLNIRPQDYMTNKLFSNIMGVNCAGNYQYNKGFFIFRDLGKIQDVEKIDMETLINQVNKKIYSNCTATTSLTSALYGRFFLTVMVDDKIKYKTKECKNFFEPYILAYNELVK